MEFLKAPLPANALPSREAFERAVQCLEKAASLEPANPDYHLALGLLYDKVGVQFEPYGERNGKCRGLPSRRPPNVL